MIQSRCSNSPPSCPKFFFVFFPYVEFISYSIYENRTLVEINRRSIDFWKINYFLNGPPFYCLSGLAADLGTKEKNRNWLDLVEAQGDSFFAICHEFPGLFGDGALSLLDKAAARYSSSDKQRRAFKAFWLMRIHITHTRGVVETIRHRFPFHIEGSSNTY